MSRVKKHTDHRVVIKPPDVTPEALAALVDLARCIAPDAEVYADRHVDLICAHCGAPWTTGGPDYNDGCCENDEAGKGD